MSNKQQIEVLSHLKKYKSITSWEAIETYKITRLSARIHELRGKGFDIFTKYITNNNTTYAEYRFISSSKEANNVR